VTALAYLERLVAFDTRNPPRAADGARALIEYVSPILKANGFHVETRDLGDGCLWLWGRRGTAGNAAPLVNIHIDTVPADARWTREPHTLHVEGERAIGLGACDIKGALAAFLTAASRTGGPVELLLTSDEEAGSSRCVRAFVAEYDVVGRAVLVAEPTRCKAVLAHRGIATCTGTFRGTAGHASQRRALEDSAVHEAVRWAEKALALASESEAADPGREVGGLPGARFNIGSIEGGIKANMIASTATVRFGVRPSGDPRAVLDGFCALAPHPGRVTWEPGYLAPALPAAGRTIEEARELVARLGLVEGAPVDFFTEAALFSEAGAVAIVIGSGDIAEAHVPDESVALAEIEELAAIYARLLQDLPASRHA
jgi:acetylornithine deacetylase